MPIGPGTIVGPYEVTTLVGEGGMGKVWQARHLTLKRSDALKVLPDSFIADPARVERFQREAQVLASLNHPNIAHVHGLEQAGGAYALVMEFVEGLTLADLIARGPVPVDDALAIARQIADALEAAHQQRIIHRDLKPANVKVRPDGVVKVLDFGLAKIAEQGSTTSSGLSMSPTTPVLTHAGFIVGTPAYMSPEQARGKPVDERTDIWAFGCVLLEMLAGRPAFEADDASLTLARVLEREPHLEGLPAALPARVRRAIELCLRKDPRQRISDIRDVRLMLDGAFEAAGAAAAAPVAAPLRHRAQWWLIGAAVGAVVGGLATALIRPMREETPSRVVRFSFAAPESVAPRGAGTGRHVLALSPTGTHLVYWADEHLRVRALDRLGEDVVLRGTEGAREPFFSPDGKWVGFFVNGEVKRVSVDGGAAFSLGTVGALWGARWHSDAVIHIGRGADGIWSLPVSGGAPTQLVKVNAGELAHGPQLLPGDDWLLFTVRRADTQSWDQAQIVAQSLGTGEQRILVQRGRDARYLPTGHLVYGVGGSLLAVPFDAAGTRVTGEPIPLIEGVVDGDVRTGAMHFSVSDDGSLVYLAGGSGQSSSLAWITRDGRQQPLPAPERAYGGPRISPDGTRAVVDVERESGGFDVVIYDFARNVLTPLAASPAREQFPTWTRDGRRVVFYSDADGGGLWWKAADGTGPTERLTTNAALQLPSTWSADGRTLVFHQTVRVPFANIKLTDPSDFYTLSLDRGNAVDTLTKTPALETQPTLSPDAKWLAYSATEGGRANIFVRPFPHVEDGRWQVSVDGGVSSLWSPDGKWLYYISERKAFAVPIEAQPTFRPGTPTAMFDLPPVYSSAGSSGWRMWDLAPDGQRFLVVIPGGVGQAEVVVVLHWTEELKRLVPSVAR